ncbi:hypothetical protein Acr_26g0000170 [Actinidia rufa]|uniref:Uncharacterized protein n=1 Tax=Actinidia rufa TaxID=165716 RepID=A0A7J0H0U8_9ERIC|nr:hypothetical protein Acr_26g0000170 [Actinidia rufa]
MAKTSNTLSIPRAKILQPWIGGSIESWRSQLLELLNVVCGIAPAPGIGIAVVAVLHRHGYCYCGHHGPLGQVPLKSSLYDQLGSSGSTAPLRPRPLLGGITSTNTSNV